MSQQPNREQLRRELSGDGPPPAAPTIVERVVAEKPAVVTLHHHATCPGLRGRECNCEANLVWLAESGVKPIERKVQTWIETSAVDGKKMGNPKSIELWRVDNGREYVTTVPGTSALKKPMPRTVKLPERWICTTCGWGGRGSNISHRCDIAAVARATRIASVSSMLTKEQRTSGAYRLVIWQDADLVYHLAEEYVADGKVERLVEIDSDGHYSVIEGALLSAVVDRFEP